MNELMAAASKGIEAAADALFMPWIVVLLFGAGLFLTVRYRFAQFRLFPEAVRTALGRESETTRGALSPFQAFMTALAASIGTGNIAGVATAIISGGPGALFWIWCYGFFATAIKFTEAVLGLQFRVSNARRHLAGPMYYLRDGLSSPALAWIYALVAGVAALTTTPFTQPNSIADVLRAQVGVPTIATGVVLAVLTWLVIIGGVKSIGRVAEKLSPLKVGLYLAGGLFVIVTYAARLPEVLALVFPEAFSMRAVAGGIGRRRHARRAALRPGPRDLRQRGGLRHRGGRLRHRRQPRPVQQGLNAVMEVFIITFVTSTISALVILLTGAWKGTERGAGAVAVAFDAAMPTVGGWMVAFCVFLFGYTTLIGWAYYGEQFLEYLLGRRDHRAVSLDLLPADPVRGGAQVDLVWAWGDLMNALQVFPNLVGLLGLSGLVAAALAARRAPAAPPATRA